MSESLFLCEVDGRGVARVTLNRPEVHNAFNDELIARLTVALAELEKDEAVRVVVLAATGKSFSAGADLKWMQRMAGYSEEENRDDAQRLAALINRLDRLAKPTLALVQGPAFGGGVGLVACCDIALAAEGASFCLSEVKLGLIPAVISPYVIAAMGERAARRYFLTAESFPAERAAQLGLVHAVVPAGELEAAGEAVIAALLAGGPQAQAAAKELIFAVAHRPVDGAVIDDTAARIARQRASAEGREGMSAFLGKRRPAWRAD
ncbi:MAG: enoyl-CoA hydratase-related protein [Kiloniellales bacterium]